MADEPRQYSATSKTSAIPVTERQRLISVDALRGFALLGILVMNIPWFAFYSFAFFNPRLDGGFEGLNFATWLGSHLIFDAKMMSIFSMLFGAGLILMVDRVERRGLSAAGVYYRRLGWLFVIGLLHAYLLWMGDILVAYSLCGLLLYPIRRWRPTKLIMLGSLLLLIGVALNMAQGHFFEFARAQSEAAAAAEAAGQEPSGLQMGMRDEWEGIISGFHPPTKEYARMRAGYQAPYLEYVAFNAPQALTMQTFLFLAWALWRVLGLMMIGMALMRLGVFSAERSTAFYMKLGAVGYGVGLPIVGFGAFQSIAHDFDFIQLFQMDWTYNYIGSILVALGHVALVMLIIRSGAFRGAIHALSAVGRMALTNYLMQSLLCAAIFFGWGAGLWGTLERFEVLGVIVAIWVFQLVVSPLWLSQFRFGPVEWLWRTLTYMKLQPFRHEKM